VLTDSLAGTTVMERNGSRDPVISVILRELVLWSIQNRVFLWFKWCPRHYYPLVLADRVSKLRNVNDWSVLGKWLCWLLLISGVTYPSLDLRATVRSLVCARYFSDVWDCTCLKVQWCQRVEWRWCDEICWCRPLVRHRSIHQAVMQFMAFGIRGYLFIPCWPNESYWHFIEGVLLLLCFWTRGIFVFHHM